MSSIHKITLVFATTLLLVGVNQSALADQPNMHEALNRLRAARAALVVAETNKGGWRERAIASVDAAILETKNGISFARTH